MALVRITTKLVDEVRNQCEHMRVAEVNQYVGGFDTAFHGQLNNEFLERMLWGDYLHLASQIPENWLTKTDNLGAELRKKNEHNQVIASLSINFRDVKIRLRPGYAGYNRLVIDMETLDQYADTFAVIEQLRESMDKHIRTMEISRKWDKTKEEVTMFLRKCKSLNEAIKLFPAIVMYVPKSYQAEVERKITRDRVDRSDLLSEAQAEELTAAAVAARLAGMVRT